MAQVPITESSPGSSKFVSGFFALLCAIALLGAIIEDASPFMMLSFALATGLFALRFARHEELVKESEPLDTAEAQTTRLATWSLIIAIASFVLWWFVEMGAPLLALVATILGFCASSRIRKSPSQFKGLRAARFGITLGMIHLILNFLLLPMGFGSFI